MFDEIQTDASLSPTLANFLVLRPSPSPLPRTREVSDLFPGLAPLYLFVIESTVRPDRRRSRASVCRKSSRDNRCKAALISVAGLRDS